MSMRNLYFVITREHAYTVAHHLETWGRSLRSYVRTVFYDDLLRYRSLRPGTYIFSDLERLSDAQLELAGAAWDALAGSPANGGAPLRLLNHPRRVLGRAALLKKLHADGINPFGVYRVNENLDTVRYPVFIRRSNEHDGSLSPLLRTPAELAEALAVARKRFSSDADLLVIEHCDTRDAAGIYRKYAAFRIGSRVFPFHINFSKNWVVKRSEFLTPELEAEEAAFRGSAEYEPMLRQIFESAKVEYGRIDFSLRNGKIVVWEINTNPSLGGDPFRAKPHRLPIIHAMVRDLNEGLAALRPETACQPTDSIPLRISPSLLRQFGLGPRQQIARHARGALRQIAQAAPWRPAV